MSDRGDLPFGLSLPAVPPRQTFDEGPAVVERVARGDRNPHLDPTPAADLRATDDAELVERRAVQLGEHDDIIERGRLTGIDVDHRPRRLIGMIGGRRPRMELDGA